MGALPLLFLDMVLEASATSVAKAVSIESGL